MAVEHLEGHRFDEIRREVKDASLVVTGEKNVTESTEGLGGSFTFCTLGEPVDLDKLLTGEHLPDYQSIGGWLFHTATSHAFAPSAVDEAKWYLGETPATFVWLIYKPDLAFLQSANAVLTLSLAEQFVKAKKGKRHLVFAAAKFVPNKTLNAMGIDFAQLPFGIYRLERD